MTNKAEEAPFVHVEDDDCMGRSYAPYNQVWADYHKRQRSLPVLVKAFWRKIIRQSYRLDNWCDESPFHYLIVLGLVVIMISIAIGTYMYLP